MNFYIDDQENEFSPQQHSITLNDTYTVVYMISGSYAWYVVVSSFLMSKQCVKQFRRLVKKCVSYYISCKATTLKSILNEKLVLSHPSILYRFTVDFRQNYQPCGTFKIQPGSLSQRTHKHFIDSPVKLCYVHIFNFIPSYCVVLCLVYGAMTGTNYVAIYLDIIYIYMILI